MRQLGFAIALSLLVGSLAFVACRRHYDDEVREREYALLRNFIKGKKAPVWEAEGVLYGPVVPGDSIRPAAGDTLVIRYALYMISSNLLLETNIEADAKSFSLPRSEEALKPLVHVVGQGGLLRGLRIGLEHFAHRGGKGWIGIPSELGYGRKRHGLVPPESPLCCYVEVLHFSGEGIPGDKE